MSEGETGEEGIESKTRSGHMQKQTFKVKQGASETDKPRNKRKENKKKSKNQKHPALPFLCVLSLKHPLCVFYLFPFFFSSVAFKKKETSVLLFSTSISIFFTLYFIKLLFLGTANDESNKNKKQRAANTLQKWQSPVCAVKHKKRW